MIQMRAMQANRIAAAALLSANQLLARRKAAPTDTRRLLLARLAAARSLYRTMRRTQGHVEKLTLDDLPRPLRWLIQSMVDALGDIFGDLESGRLTVAAWLDLMREKIAEYHLASIMAGLDSEIVPERAWGGLVEQVNMQLGFLDNFTVEIQKADEFAAGWKTRAESYAGAVKQPYWFGRTRLLPLPAMPAQGTTCGNNCKCRWRIDWLDQDKGDANAFWMRHADDSCQICLERESQWSPVKIRDGMLE
jgi:hypothetical protein